MLTKCMNLNIYPDCCIICEFSFSWKCIHHNVGVHLESTESICSHEFLWINELSGSLPTMGFAGIFTALGEFSYSRFDG